jgi:hypothetical protein
MPDRSAPIHHTVGSRVPKRPAPKAKKAVETWQSMVNQAEAEYGALTDQMLQEYMKLAGLASGILTRGAARAQRAYTQIEGPATAAYTQQMDAAEATYNAIMGPVSDEYQRIMTQAQNIYSTVVGPAETAFTAALSDAASGTSVSD